MYKVKYGGKKGKTLDLVESPDMVVIRTRGNKDLQDVKLSETGQQILSASTEVTAFPEAGVTVRRVGNEGRSKEEKISQRDKTRSALKQEESIRFAGRVLQDKKSGEVVLYTENFFLKFKDDTPESACLECITRHQLKVKNKLPFAENAYFVQASEGTGLQVFDIADALLKEKEVEYCHPEMVQERRFKGIHPLQWHLAKTKIGLTEVNAHVNIEAAWALTKGKGVTVCVIDDGIDIDHPEFAGRVVHPYDATSNTNDPRPKDPEDKHGTPCAGMACAAGLKDGASGTAPEAFLMPVRLRSGLGSMAEANAFAWAADHGADVISCSWGPSDGNWWDPKDPLHKNKSVMPDSTRLAIEYALKKGRGGKGCVILFAAGNGNESIDNDGYCAYPGLIAVAACNDRGLRCVYSDFGSAVWVSFPSRDFPWEKENHPAPISSGLRSTDRLAKDGYNEGDYTNTFGGTSGACPGMAGVVALMLAANPQLSAVEVKMLIAQSCKRLDEKTGKYDADGHSIYYGFGRIDAGLAVENARKSRVTQGQPRLEGGIRYEIKGPELALLPGLLMSSPTDKQTITNIRLRLTPPQADLKLSYRANVTGLGIVESAKEGDFVGLNQEKQRLIGFSAELSGKAAVNYDLEYRARLKGEETLATAKNGAFCGTNLKNGKTITAISVRLRKKA